MSRDHEIVCDCFPTDVHCNGYGGTCWYTAACPRHRSFRSFSTFFHVCDPMCALPSVRPRYICTRVSISLFHIFFFPSITAPQLFANPTVIRRPRRIYSVTFPRCSPHRNANRPVSYNDIGARSRNNLIVLPLRPRSIVPFRLIFSFAPR
jgi:hypothetical protein